MSLLLAVKTVQPGESTTERIAGPVVEPQAPPTAPIRPPPAMALEPTRPAPPAPAKSTAAPVAQATPPRKPKAAEPRKDPLSPPAAEPGPMPPVVSSVPPGPGVMPEPVLRAPLIIVARIERLQGDAWVLAGATRRPAKAGIDLVSGQGLETSALGGVALLKYPDGTRIELAPRTVVWDGSDKPTAKNPEGGLRRLRVMTGTLTAEVPTQPEGRPFVLTSFHAEAKIPGAVLKVVTEPESMRFDLTQGKVRVTRREDQIFVDLEPGQFVTVGRGLGFDVRAIPPK